MREVERYHSDQVLRDRDASKKAAMKEYADSSCHLWHGSRGVILKNGKNLNKLLVFEALYP